MWEGVHRSGLIPAIRLIVVAGCVGVFVSVYAGEPTSNSGLKSATKAKSKASTKKRTIDFNRDVRPILANNCFACHGPDERAVRAELQLSSRTLAMKLRDGGKRAIVPGSPNKSELIRRINAKDKDVRMPPEETHKVLTDADKATLRRWIEEGAEYKEHWAYVAPVRPVPPAAAVKGWARNPIDAFVLARMIDAGLKPSPEADRATLLRRVSLDLTGLPPTPAELHAFLTDKRPDAYERLVDRLLASPRYGERMAVDWLDGARYADSNGYQADYERYQWRWRDWVIDALNANMPFDQFAIEQLAGDLLPNATLSQKIATGFNRNHRINTEGGVIAEEWRVENVIDRVSTTATVFLGLTAECARCHDHKYDPLPQKEFYKLFAYFNNVPESGSGEERPVNHPPLLAAPTVQQEQQLAKVRARYAELDQWVKARLEANAPKVSGWTAVDRSHDASLAPGLEARYVLGSAPKIVDGKAPAPKVVGAVAADVGRSTGASITTRDAYVDLGTAADVERSEAFSFGAWIYPEDGNGAALARMDSGNDFRGWDLFFDGGRPLVHLIHKWPDNALKVICREVIPLKKWSHVFVTYDGSSKPEGISIFINGKPAPYDTERNSLTESIRTTVPATLGRRTGNNMFVGRIDDFAFYRRTLPSTEVALLADVHPAKRLQLTPETQRTAEQIAELRTLWSIDHDAEFKSRFVEMQSSKEEAQKIESSIPTVMVMEEMKRPRPAYVLTRGEYDKHGQMVYPATPTFLPALPKGPTNNRLDFARWLMRPENPLTARVAVNRMWERFFGTGIVATTEDFGTRAEFPTHPELLDWLATEFVRLKWDMKAMQKAIVMSATYRQASSVSVAVEKVDPQNRLLSRGPRFRLPAEMIRDQALYISGLLVEKLGGPSVRPYQPEGIWDETNEYGNLRNYKADQGEGLYRRSMYTIWKRTAAPPNMTLFDMSTRELCRIRRSRTNTPLQALTLMNELTFVEAARVMAQRVLREGGSTDASKLTYAFELAVSRKPTAQELGILSKSLAKYRARYQANLDGAKRLISHGASPVDEKLDPTTLAAFTVSMNTILNLDEVITKG